MKDIRKGVPTEEPDVFRVLRNTQRHAGELDWLATKDDSLTL